MNPGEFVELLRGPEGITDNVDEAALLRRVRRGDETAFAQLYGYYQRPIYRYAARMCGDEAADDLVQETFMVVLRQQDRFDATRGPFGGYLFGIARNLVLKRLGRRYEEPLDDEIDPADPSAAADTLATLSRRERMDAVHAAVQSLPPVYREVVVLCDLEELDYAETARILACPLGTVRSRLHRARAILASKLTALRTVARSC